MTRKQAYFAGIAICAILPSSVSAETLQQALEGAYRNNPTISAQRASIRVAEEDVPLARVAGMPTIDGSATYQENVLTGKPAPGGFFSNPDRQFVGQLNANVPLLDFGAVRGSMSAAKARVEASHFGLNQTEADLFSAVVGAYMDVLRDEAVVGLNRNNVDVMRYTVKEAVDRRRAGSRGPTDVAQAEARLALAESQMETAGARLISSKEQYIRLVGHAAENLELPPPLPQMPSSPTEAVETALANNPEIASARVQRTAAGYDIDVARSQAYPKFSAIGGISQYDYLGSLDQGTGPRNGDRGTTAFVGLTLKMPILDGGRTGAQTRQALAKQDVADKQALDAEGKVIAEARSAFATWQAATHVTDTAQRGVTANQQVLAGMRAEVSAGLRPLLDQLNAEQELLNAQVTMLTARRDAYVAGFALLAVMGKADAADLNFDKNMLYQPTVKPD